MAGRKWTLEETEKLRELYPDCFQAKDLCEILNRTEKSIYMQAKELGLKRNSNPRWVNLGKFDNGFRFQKGLVPWNKGLKGIDMGGKETRFKKGNIPNNTKYFGKPYLLKRKRKGGSFEIYWMIQELGSNKRQNYARFLWKQHHGPIPSGFIVYYLNGLDEKKAPEISDLGLMSKADNMDRNTIHRYPRELKQSIRLLKKLNRNLNKQFAY